MYHFKAGYSFSYDGTEWQDSLSNAFEAETVAEAGAIARRIVAEDLQFYIDHDVPGGTFHMEGTTAEAKDSAGNIVCRIRDISAHPEYPPEPTVTLCKGYACKWGLTDLYPEAEAILRGLVDSRKPFDTGWCGCCKEIRSFRVMSDGQDRIMVRASEDIDEVPDIIYDADMHDELTEEDIEEIGNVLDLDFEFRTETTSDRTLPIDASYDEIMEALSELEDENRRYLNDMFERHVVPLVKYALEEKHKKNNS